MEHRYAPEGLDLTDAGQVTDRLQTRLADLIDLSLTLKHVHWNVVGWGFMSMHKLMDEQTDTVRVLVDEMAERISSLGGVAAGLTSQVADNRTSDGDYSLGRGDVVAHLGALDKVYSRVCMGHRDVLTEVGDLDPVSEDLIISQLRALELNHWFVRAHLENIDGRLPTEGSQSELAAAEAAVLAPLPGEEPSKELEGQPA